MAVLGDRGEFYADGSESTSDKSELIVSSSTSGVETVACLGVFGGATVELQTETRLRDGSRSSGLVTIPGATFTSDFIQSATIGKGQPVTVKVTGISATTNIVLESSGVFK